LGGKGNVLIVRGIKGSGIDQQTYAGEMEGLKQFPDMKIVGEVYGSASGPVAQAAVSAALPSLPKIDAVFAQGGGDAFGIVQAFQQYGGRYANALPVIVGDGSTDFVKWWKAEKAKNGYSTISMHPTPTIGEAAVWYTIAILNGANPPKHKDFPETLLKNSDLDQFTSFPPNQMITVDTGKEWVNESLLK
jgi:ribose transport system substrate-binding protein